MTEEEEYIKRIFDLYRSFGNDKDKIYNYLNEHEELVNELFEYVVPHVYSDSEFSHKVHYNAFIEFERDKKLTELGL